MRMMIKDIITKMIYVAGEAEMDLLHRKYEETKPDLVLMDITMPEMDGISSIKEIMARDPNAKVSVFLL